MKNFGVILTFIAASVALVSARALPLDQPLDARDVIPFDGAAEIGLRSPKKAATHTTDATATQASVAAVTSSAAAKKAGIGGSAKHGKDGKKGTAAGNATAAAQSKDAAVAAVSCAPVSLNSTAVASNATADATNTTAAIASASSAAATKGGKNKGHKGKGNETKIGGDAAANATTVADGKGHTHGQAAGQAPGKQKRAAANTDTTSGDTMSTLAKALGLIG